MIVWKADTRLLHRWVRGDLPTKHAYPRAKSSSLYTFKSLNLSPLVSGPLGTRVNSSSLGVWIHTWLLWLWSMASSKSQEHITSSAVGPCKYRRGQPPEWAALSVRRPSTSADAGSDFAGLFLVLEGLCSLSELISLLKLSPLGLMNISALIFQDRCIHWLQCCGNHLGVL